MLHLLNKSYFFMYLFIHFTQVDCNEPNSMTLEEICGGEIILGLVWSHIPAWKYYLEPSDPQTPKTRHDSKSFPTWPAWIDLELDIVWTLGGRSKGAERTDGCSRSFICLLLATIHRSWWCSSNPLVFLGSTITLSHCTFKPLGPLSWKLIINSVIWEPD